MPGKGRLATIIVAIICSLSLMLFSFLIKYELPLRIIAVSVLSIPAFVIARNIRSFNILTSKAGEYKPTWLVILYFITGIIIGIIVAVMYRYHLDLRLFPRSFHFFAIIAAFIGSTEELVFRGFLQEYVKGKSPLFSILFSSFSHTGYKCCLFISPASSSEIDIIFLAFWTFLMGLVLGTIKHLSKSILPPLSAHALFDILVYSESLKAPWWVW